jgi:hypothetical protein
MKIRITAIRIMTIRVTTIRITTISINDKFSSFDCHHAEFRIFYCYAECHYAECRYAKCGGACEMDELTDSLLSCQNKTIISSKNAIFFMLLTYG